jgi:hypothetical protein
MPGMSKSTIRCTRSESDKLLLAMVRDGKTFHKNDAATLACAAGTNHRLPLAWAEELVSRDLAVWRNTLLAPTDAGRAWVARKRSPDGDGFRRQHSRRRRVSLDMEGIRRKVEINEAESPLAWLRRRQGKNGMAFIGAAAFAAGERLRVDFTMANLMPRVTTNWQAPEGCSSAGDPVMFSDAVLSARQRVKQVMEAVGPELSGILTDVVCFLKGLEQVESERGWPARSAKIVLSLALDRLARHYGLSDTAVGRPTSRRIRTWSAAESEAG